MWFYLYILASKKRAQRLFEKEWKRFGNIELEKKAKRIVSAFVWVCVQGFQISPKNYVSEWEIYQVVHILEVARMIAWKEGTGSVQVWNSMKLERQHWQEIKNDRTKCLKNESEKRVKQNNQGTKLLVVWIWSDGTNDERARGVLKKARINQP